MSLSDAFLEGLRGHSSPLRTAGEMPPAGGQSGPMITSAANPSSTPPRNVKAGSAVLNSVGGSLHAAGVRPLSAILHGTAGTSTLVAAPSATRPLTRLGNGALQAVEGPLSTGYDGLPLPLAGNSTINQNPSKQDKKQSRRPRQSKHHYHFFKRTGQSASGTKAATLVATVTPLSNVKEEIFAALDEWVAFEVEFPIIAVGKALKRLKQREQWLRIIQVSKWMLSKGQGKTFGTYNLLLKAYEMDARLEDCEVLWEKLLMHYARSVPKSMFSLMMNIYKRQQMLGKLVEVFEQMESFNMRPDKDTLEMVKDAYRQLGQPEKQQSLTAKYPPAWNYLKFKGKTIKVRPRPEINKSTAEPEADFEGDIHEEIS